MRQVAAAAGVSVSTVSKALRNDASLPPQRCRSIQALAKQLGYRPHPHVASLMAQLHHSRRQIDPPKLAWIDFWSARAGERAPMSSEPLLRGARTRAEELGYAIEVHRPAAEGISGARLRQLLLARDQWALIIPPVPDHLGSLPFDLNGLACVTIGTSLREPPMHRVTPNHFQGSVLAFHAMRAAGFRRIGLALSPAMNDRVEGRWLGGFLAARETAPPADRVAPLLAGTDDRAALVAWLQRERPDAVLVAEDFGWKTSAQPRRSHHASPTLAWLLSRARATLGYVEYRPEELGRVAVELAVAQVQRNERGSPRFPQTVAIDASWVRVARDE